MKWYIKENFKATKNMDKALYNGKMEIIMKVIFSITKFMDKENYILIMETYTLDNFTAISYKDMVP